jgi:hypothetical protein
MFNATFASPTTTPPAEGGIGLGNAPLAGTSSVAAAANPGLGETDKLRLELDRLQAQQRELMQLLGTSRPDRIVHDVRNLLQERMFLEAACKKFGG